jgi:succinate dehydrogenase/fumarate reductase flavoprotein subunit
MSQLNLDDYNQLVINTADSCAEKHKVRTCVYKHLKTGKLYFTIGKPVIECTNGFEENIHKVIYSDGIRIYCREETEFNQKFKLL